MDDMGVTNNVVSVIEISYKDKYIDCFMTTPEIADKIMEELSSHISNLFEGVEVMRNDITPETDLKFAVRRFINKVYRASNNGEI